jgi:hypothetical protein
MNIEYPVRDSPVSRWNGTIMLAGVCSNIRFATMAPIASQLGMYMATKER